MDTNNLKTASLYINNLLLSRGLLRNGKAIDFARPERDEGGLEATMGRVMGVVNDLVLKRDRDAEQRESLAHSMRALRADAQRLGAEHARLQEQNGDAARRLGLAEATERGLRGQLRAAEQAARGLREDAARARALVAQTRAQCANEVRRRERALDGLRRHVGEGARARGSGRPAGVAIVSVVAGVGAAADDDDADARPGTTAAAAGLDESGYDLRTETSEFLTQLARSLSEENERLGGLARATMETLRAISGLGKADERETGMVVVHSETSLEDLTAGTDEVIEHLRTLLTNPSFVPLEEVEIREDEIIRLREGWEKMEDRWREAVQMMDGWMKRMAKSGQTVNLEELKMGLKLSPLKTQESTANGSAGRRELDGIFEEDEGEGETQADIDALNDSGIQPPQLSDEMSDVEGESDDDSSVLDEIPDDNGHEQQGSEQQDEEDSLHTASSISLGPQPQISPLREITDAAGNRGGAFTTILEESTWDLANMDSDARNNSSSHLTSQRPRQQLVSPCDSQQDQVKLSPDKPRLKSQISDHLSAATSSENVSPRKPAPTAETSQPKSLAISASSRLPRPHQPQPQQSPLTMASIAAKLAATEREADAARVRAKLKAAKQASSSRAAAATVLKPPVVPTPTTEEPTAKPVKRTAVAMQPPGGSAGGGDAEVEASADAVKPTKRKRKAPLFGAADGRRKSRRRSTLSPWELETLMAGNVPSPVK